ncbi:type II secretion system F family protein [bacterium]|mgnify:CR=1 FL=1|jgi:type II secretory pathway component PulF|nr:type II secretion system F family protein [bacterium]MBT5015018.1 type II secretion system F family protein [bacterium]
MALYFYQALSKDGKKIKGQIDAGSEADARFALTRKGMFPISIGTGEGQMSLFKRMLLGKVTIKDKILFTKQLAVLLKSGIPLLQALELLVEQFEGRLRAILIDIKDSVKEGSSFAECLGRYPGVFSNIYVQLVRAGEATGNLETILVRLTSYLERKLEVDKKVKSAMRGPIIQIGVVVLVVIVLLTFVVPKMAATFAQGGAQMPWATRVIMNLSSFFTGHYIILIVGSIISLGSFLYWSKTAAGRRILDKIKLKIPIIKFFTRYGAIVQFAETLGMLLEGGVNLSEALDIVVKITSNSILSSALSEARDKIIKEGKITEYLKQTNIFPPIAIYLIKTGEESGKLDEMLLTLGTNYEMELSEYADGLSAKIEPIMLLVMAGVVGFVVIAMALPMMKMGEVVSNIK